MIKFSNVYRSAQEEIMDDFEFQGKEMQDVLADLRRINRYLGGNKITINGIEQLLQDVPGTEPLTILDVGCGDGEMLRKCADHFNTKRPNISFIGIDANPMIISEAIASSSSYSNISFKTADVLNSDFLPVAHDIVLFTLFLHHFEEDEITALLQKFNTKARFGLVINDLERNRLAFVLFKIVSTLFSLSKTAKNDGLISIAKGFKRRELQPFSAKITGKHRVKWKWAFRFQWIVKNI